MSARWVKAVLLVVALSALAADVTVGCGSQSYVYGVVQAKNSGGSDADQTTLIIADSSFTVPIAFFEQVQVGDWVRFDGKTWTIVKKYNADVTPSLFGPAPAKPAATPAPSQ